MVVTHLVFFFFLSPCRRPRRFHHLRENLYYLEFSVCFSFMMVWIVPIAFILSASAEEDCLPGGYNAHHRGVGVSSSEAGGGMDGSLSGSKKARSVARQMINFVLHKKEELLPSISRPGRPL